MSAGDLPSADDLYELGEKVAELTRKLEKTPGLSEGNVEQIATAIERILRDYGGASYRQYRNLVRDLDLVAADVSRFEKEKALHPKFVRYLDASLLRIRKRDFYLGRKLLERLGKARAQAKERDGLLEEYREGYREIEREITRLKADREHLRSVRRPPVSEAEVERVKTLLDSANRAIAHAVIAELHGVPSRLALPAFQEGSKDRRLLLPRVPEGEVAPLLALLEDVGTVRDAFGNRGVHSLLEALTFSDAKLAHLLGDGRPLKAVLNPNLSWLKAITAPGTLLPPLSIDLPIEELRGRVEAIAGFAEKLHDVEGAREPMAGVTKALESGALAKAQEADRAYRTFGDAARRAWEGTLEKGIRDVERDLEKRTKDLSGLRSPDRLL